MGERAPEVGVRGEGVCWSGPLTPGPNKGLSKDCHWDKMDGTGAARPFVAGDERQQALRVPQGPRVLLAPHPSPQCPQGPSRVGGGWGRAEVGRGGVSPTRYFSWLGCSYLRKMGTRQRDSGDLACASGYTESEAAMCQ